MIGVAGRYVTEDFSRKVRKHREELIKFAKSLRNVEPDARSSHNFYLIPPGDPSIPIPILSVRTLIATVLHPSENG